MQNRYYGWLDPRISDNGKKQAENLGRGLRASDLKFEACFTSDLARCILTLEHAGLKGMNDLRVMKGLREKSLGANEGLTFDELLARHPDFFNEAPNVGSAFSEGETLEEFTNRVLETFAEIRRKSPGGDILIMTHGGFIKTMIASIVESSFKGTMNIVIDNCSVTVLDDYGDSLTVKRVNSAVGFP